MAIRNFGDWTPQIAEDAFVAPSADVMGQVVLERGASVWYGCVLRGDIEAIVVGENSNIQDLSVLHTDHGHPVFIGRDVTVGHQACIHGAKIGDGCLIGMGATVLSGAEIGEGSMVGAGALVPEGKKIPPGMLAVGVPCQIKRELSAEEKEKLRAHAGRYCEYAQQHIKQIQNK